MATGRPESELSNLLADIMVWAGTNFGEQPQLGVYNMGGIRANLPAGKVTKGDILNVAPFENKICFLTLTGGDLLLLFREIAHRGGEGVSHGVELTITKGRGYISADKGKTDDMPIGVIAVDSIYTPVDRVNYKVENTRVGQVTDYDKLTMDIWTNGTLAPDEVVSLAAKGLRMRNQQRS